MSNRELLQALIQDVINDRTEQAGVTFHNYVVPTTQSIIGLGQQPAADVDTDSDDVAADEE